MDEDLRCCGTGTCLINADGECWCGQRWDGEKMCFAEKKVTSDNQRAAMIARPQHAEQPSPDGSI